jgi:hypothetical protein
MIVARAPARIPIPAVHLAFSPVRTGASHVTHFTLRGALTFGHNRQHS